MYAITVIISPGLIPLLRVSWQISRHLILIAHENVELFSRAWILFPGIIFLPSVAVLNS